jgi:hypothetical protein
MIFTPALAAFIIPAIARTTTPSRHGRNADDREHFPLRRLSSKFSNAMNFARQSLKQQSTNGDIRT